jgi:hypothetical protein
VPWSSWADAAPLSFRVRERTKYQKNIDIERVAENLADGTWAPADVVELARIAGALLARAHSDLAQLDFQRPQFAIAQCANQPEFLQATRDWVSAARTRFDADYHAFQRLLQERGPTLGYVSSTTPLRTR